MSDTLVCYRCGASLAALTLPFSRYDECPSCTRPLRVCRMCTYFAPDVPRQCREDEAEEVAEKEQLNFCDWFKPGHDLFDADAASQESRAKQELAALFGENESAAADPDALTQQAEDLFK